MTKIMLVEDDNNLREIYEARLAAEGYEIVAAQDGEAALALAAKERPELIISDVMMPKISGFEMLDIIRNTDGIKNAKVIMLTALGQTEDSSRAAALGADRYLVKSQVTLEDIVKATHELIDSGSVPSSPQTEAASPEPVLPEVPKPAASPVIQAPPAQPMGLVAPPPVTPPTPAVAPQPVVIPVTDTPQSSTASTPAALPTVPAPSEPTDDNSSTPDVSTDTGDSSAVPSPPPVVEPTPEAEAEVIPAVATEAPVETTIESEAATEPPLTATEHNDSAAPETANDTTDAVSDSTDIETTTPETVTDAPTPSEAPAQQYIEPDPAIEASNKQVDEAIPQGIAEEEAAIQAQIDSFIHSQETSPEAAPEAPSEPSVENTDTTVDEPEMAVPAAPETPQEQFQPSEHPQIVTEPTNSSITNPPDVSPAPTATPAPVTAPVSPEQQNVSDTLNTMIAETPTTMQAAPILAPSERPDPVAAAPVQAPAPEAQAVAPEPVSQSANAPVAGKKKIIGPLSSGPKLDIHQLLEVEEAKMAAQQATTIAAAPVVMPTEDETPIAVPSPAVVVSGQNSQDPNSIAL